MHITQEMILAILHIAFPDSLIINNDTYFAASNVVRFV